MFYGLTELVGALVWAIIIEIEWQIAAALQATAVAQNSREKVIDEGLCTKQEGLPK